MGGGGVKGTVRHTRVDPSTGTLEHPDEMIYVARDGHGEVTDAGIEDFVDLERITGRYLKLTLTGKDPDKPFVLVIQAESKITVRPLGTKPAGAAMGELK